MKIEVRKNKKKISLSFKLLYLLLVSLLVISFSMSRYRTTYQGSIQGDLAKWIFKIDGSSTTFTVNLADTTRVSSDYAYNRGVIAPSAKGSFDIELDCTDCDVAVEYAITITPNANSTIPRELYIYSLDLDPNKTSIKNKTITKEISLTDINDNGIIPITVNWMWQVNFDDNESEYETEEVILDVTIIGKQLI